MSDKWKGHIVVVAANVIFGLNVPVTKALLDRWMTPLGYMETRTLAALLIFAESPTISRVRSVTNAMPH